MNETDVLLDRPPRDARARWASRLVRLAGVLLLAAFALWIWRGFDHESFLAWKREAGPLPFFAALAVLPAFGVPTTPFYLLAGATFGIVVALVGAGASLALNLALCFWIAQSGLRPAIERALARTRFTLPRVKPDHELRFVLVAKLMPGVPTFVKNYLISLSGVAFGLYFGVSFVVTMAYAAVFIVLGESLYEQDYSDMAWAAAVLVALVALLWWVRRRVGRAAVRETDP